jgi:nucleoside phosphorylase
MRGIVIATMIEASSFINRLQLDPEPGHPFKIYTGGDECLVITGIGKAACAMGTAYAAVKFGFDEAYNCGAAGALKTGFSSGDIFTVEKIAEPDRPMLGSNEMRWHRAEPVPGAGCAVLATMDRPVLSETGRAAAAEISDLADMEGAAFVQACLKFGVRAHLLKMVSDIPGSAEKDIIANIRLYGARMADFYAGLFPGQQTELKNRAGNKY